MERVPRIRTTSPTTSEALITTIVVICILYFGRAIFQPLAMAVLLSFVLSPAVSALRRLHFGRSLSVIAVIFVAAVLMACLGFILTRQLSELAQSLPRYEAVLKDKIKSLQGSGSQSVLDRATEGLEQLSKEIAGSQQGDGTGASPPSGKPVAVEIRQPAPALDRYQSVLKVVSEPLATAGIVFVFLIFILLQREDLRDRVIRLTGPRDVQRTTAAMNDASRRLSRYFLAQTAVNSLFGCVIAAGLWLIGVPNPILWGFVAALMRFVPFIGSYIAAAAPLALAAGVEPGWSAFLWTLALYIVGETTVGQVVEPLLYGQSTGLSPLAVIVAASFWAWLWGPLGLIMAVPLTACIVVLARHVERFEFLYVLLNDAPALTAAERFYQRVLTGNAHEAVRDAAQFLKTQALSAYYDEAAIPGLALAQQDLERGLLERDRLHEIQEAVAEILADLEDYEDVTPAHRSDPADTAQVASTELAHLDPEQLPQRLKDAPVLVLGARTPLDTAAAVMLAQLFAKRGIPSEALSLRTPGRKLAARLDLPPASLICLSCYGSSGIPSQIGYIARRLQRILPEARLILCCWGAKEGDRDLFALAEATDAIGIAATLQEAISMTVNAIEAEPQADAPPKEMREQVDRSAA